MNKVPPKVAWNQNRSRSIVVPSTVYNNTNAALSEDEGIEETEITAQISLPAEGGWGWVVVVASFFVIFVIDGIYFTFGSIFHDMVQDLGMDETLVSLTSSIAVAMYFLAGPVASALINRFGFRVVCMSGSVITALALLCTYFATSFASILILYGVIGGFGASLANLSAGLVVGFYFERLRGLAMSISSVGSSFGIMIMFWVNSYLVEIAGWRVIMLLHSGLCGTTYFYAMTYRPLLSLTVTTTADTDRTVTYLPNMSTVKVTPSGVKTDGGRAAPSAVARLFSTVSNVYYPTAAAVVGEMTQVPTPTQAGPSAAAASRITITAQGPQGGISRRQLKKVQSLVSKSRTSVPDKSDNTEKQIELNILIEKSLKKKWWQRLCHWEEHVSEARPMYRDDAFFHSKVENLPAYQKQMMETAPEERTGLEYQMAVSRAVTAAELKEKKGIFTTAVKRILVTMLDPKLLSRVSFLILCTSSFFTYLGYLVPYIFLTDRAKSEGLPHEHCNLFVCVIGFANVFGRLIFGTLAMKYNPVTLYLVICLLAGLSVIAFNFSFNLYYQYAICLLFGFHIGSLSLVRSVVIVHLYGLEMLTNGTGILLLFQGLGSLISTPASSIIKNMFGYAVSFYVAGIFILISGVILIPVGRINARENMKSAQPKQPASPKKGGTPNRDLKFNEP